MDAALVLVLQTLWRSGGTWIWGGYRSNRSCRAYYEPLHESLARFSDAELRQACAGATAQLRHPNFETHYFSEYPVEKQGGVFLFPLRSALENFIQDETESDSETQLYLERLIGYAAARGQVPVFKFCRATLRAGWLRQVLPRSAFIYLNRNPEDLHRSYWSQGAATNYFTVQYAAALLLHRQNPLMKPVADYLLGVNTSEASVPLNGESALQQAGTLCRDKGAQFGRDLTLLFWTQSLLGNRGFAAEIFDYDQLVASTAALDRLREFSASALACAPSFIRPHAPLQPEVPGHVVDPEFAGHLAAGIGQAGLEALTKLYPFVHEKSQRVIASLVEQAP